tara:strand:- start:918 stop:1571 length:654 start_codon:yes stop_codon:yes gene_type:complete
MKKAIEIKVPNDYSAITLRQYIKIQKDIKNYEGEKEAQDAFLIYNLCGLTPETISKIDSVTLSGIRDDLDKLMSKTDYDLQRFKTIEGVKYGFEPNLSEMPYGAYLDITKFEEITIDKNWPQICNILFRPITKTKVGVFYEIEPYKGAEPWDDDKWLDVTMDFHFGCFFFFTRIYKDLLQGIQSSLKRTGEIPDSINRILEESGKAIQQLSSLQTKI